MNLVVNGASRTYTGRQTVASLVEDMSSDRADIAVALDGRVVPRSAWHATEVPEGAHVEVVSAVQGG